MWRVAGWTLLGFAGVVVLMAAASGWFQWGRGGAHTWWGVNRGAFTCTWGIPSLAPSKRGWFLEQRFPDGAPMTERFEGLSWRPRLTSSSTTSQTAFRCSLLFLGALPTMAGAAALWRGLPARVLPGHCPRCRYDLGGLTKCPECGCEAAGE